MIDYFHPVHFACYIQIHQSVSQFGSLLIRRFVGERRRSLLRFESHSFDRFIHLLANWEYQDIILSQGAELSDRLHHHFDDVGVESTTKRSV